MGDCLLFPQTLAKHEDQFCFQHRTDTPKGTLRRGPGGAVVTDDQIEGHPMLMLVERDAAFYGGNYLVCESMPETIGPVLAAALGMKWEG